MVVFGLSMSTNDSHSLKAIAQSRVSRTSLLSLLEPAPKPVRKMRTLARSVGPSGPRPFGLTGK
jgi:hypothetical protein